VSITEQSKSGRKTEIASRCVAERAPPLVSMDAKLWSRSSDGAALIDKSVLAGVGEDEGTPSDGSDAGASVSSFIMMGPGLVGCIVVRLCVGPAVGSPVKSSPVRASKVPASGSLILFSSRGALGCPVGISVTEDVVESDGLFEGFVVGAIDGCSVTGLPVCVSATSVRGSLSVRVAADGL